MPGATTGAIFRPQTNAAGETCSYCKLVGVRKPGAVVLTACGACRRLRRVRVLYCSRKCQRGAWPRHRACCGASAWSLEQHRCHRPATRHYVARLTQEVMIYTLFWRREPSYAKRLFLGRVLPYLVAYDARVPRCWLRDLRLADAAYRRYVARLAAEMAHTLLWRRASNVAKRVWRERVLPFLLEDAAPPPGWGAA